MSIRADDDRRGGRARLASLALLGVSALLSLAAAEIALRLGGRDLALWNHFAPHEELGWTFGPEDGKPGGRLATNRLGFRDVEHEVRKPPGTRRLVLLGDSFTASTQVRLDAIYPRRLQHLLDLRAAEPWEVISLAVNGWGTVQEWLALERYGLAYRPDAILLQFFPNDVCNNAPSAAGYCDFHDDMRPYAAAEGPELRIVWREPLRRRLRLGSALYRVTERAVALLRLRWLAGSAATLPANEEAWLERADQAARREADLGAAMHLFYYAYAADAQQVPPVAEGWRIAERLVEQMARSQRERGIAFGLLVMPWEGAVDPAAWEATWQAEPPPVPLEREYPERRLARLAERLGIPALLLLPRFQQNRELVLPYRNYHLNREGHRITAEAILEWLVAQGLVRLQGAPGASEGGREVPQRRVATASAISRTIASIP